MLGKCLLISSGNHTHIKTRAAKSKEKSTTGPPAGIEPTSVLYCCNDLSNELRRFKLKEFSRSNPIFDYQRGLRF